MSLYLEPEGCEFQLPPGKLVEVRLFGQNHPVEMKYSVDGSGARAVSFWPESGEFELFFDGKVFGTSYELERRGKQHRHNYLFAVKGTRTDADPRTEVGGHP